MKLYLRCEGIGISCGSLVYCELMRQEPVNRFIRVLHDQMSLFRKRYGVKSIALFGSYVRHAQRRSSDLDLLVEFSKATSLFQFVAFERDLSDLLGVKVDWVMKTALKPAIGKRILREVVPVPA